MVGRERETGGREGEGDTWGRRVDRLTDTKEQRFLVGWLFNAPATG